MDEVGVAGDGRLAGAIEYRPHPRLRILTLAHTHSQTHSHALRHTHSYAYTLTPYTHTVGRAVDFTLNESSKKEWYAHAIQP